MATAAIAAASLGRGESLGLLIDQYFGRGIDLPFFGRPARTAPTLAKIAQHFDCPIIGAVVERVKRCAFLPAFAARGAGNPHRRRAISTPAALMARGDGRWRIGCAPIPNNGSGFIAAGARAC